jgi:hypothetical protein
MHKYYFVRDQKVNINVKVAEGSLLIKNTVVASAYDQYCKGRVN